MIRFLFKNAAAIALVAIVHLIAFTPASLTSSKSPRVTPARKVRCEMAFGEGAWSVPEIVSWSYLNDPTVFALDDPATGFGASVSHRLPPMYSAAKPYAATVHTQVPDRAPPPPVSTRISFAAPPSRLRGPRLPGDSRSPASAARLPNSPLWNWEDGRPVVAPPPLAGPPKAGAAPWRETILDLGIAGRRWHLRLAQSCGVPELDDAAFAAVGRELSKMETTLSGTGTCFGRDFAAGAAQIHVEWRASGLAGGGGNGL